MNMWRFYAIAAWFFGTYHWIKSVIGMFTEIETVHGATFLFFAVGVLLWNHKP